MHIQERENVNIESSSLSVNQSRRIISAWAQMLKPWNHETFVFNLWCWPEWPVGCSLVFVQTNSDPENNSDVPSICPVFLWKYLVMVQTPRHLVDCSTRLQHERIRMMAAMWDKSEKEDRDWTEIKCIIVSVTLWRRAKTDYNADNDPEDYSGWGRQIRKLRYDVI